MTEPTRLWHPFAAMGKVDGHELVLARGEGCRVWDADGNEYLDATAGPLVRERRPRPRGDRGRGRRRSSARSPRTTSSATTRTSPRSSWRGALAELVARRRRRRLLRHERRRGDRHGREDRPPLLGARRTARAHGDRLTPLRLPRHERVRHLALRDPGRTRRLRHARRRRRRGRPRRPGRRSRASSTSSTAASRPSSASR